MIKRLISTCLLVAVDTIRSRLLVQRVERLDRLSASHVGEEK